MNSPKLVIAAVAVSLAGLLCGCGSSSTAPVMPLAIITPSPLASGESTVPYNASLTANGGLAPYIWSTTSGTLPPGLSLSSVGTLSGTPTAAGTYSFSVSVTDSQRSPSTANTNLSVTIVPALQITTTSLSNTGVGLFYNSTLTATGGFPAYTWSITQGSLPGGLTLNASNGVISGTPTGSGTSPFTVKVTDNGTPATAATANLSIAINPSPARNAALYVGQGSGGPPGPAWDQTGLQIQADGSLTLLPSSPESAIHGSNFAGSPTLSLVFLVGNQTGDLESLLVNPDYSLSLYSSSAPLPGNPQRLHPSVDPTGSNLYLPGLIDNNGTVGVTIFRGDGSLTSTSSLAIPNVDLNNPPKIVFTPDGRLAFLPTCIEGSPSQGNILSFSRASDGTLTAAATYTLSSYCVNPMAVSPDGKFLAASSASNVQIYAIATGGTLTAVLPRPLTVTFGPNVPEFAYVTDMVWDQSSSFLIFSVVGSGVVVHVVDAGVGVLSFSGTTLTQTVDPIPNGTGPIWRAGSFVYVMRPCEGLVCGGPVGIDGFDFQNGQLIPLPGSTFPYGNGAGMMIY